MLFPSDKQEKDGSTTERDGQILMLTDDEVASLIKVWYHFITIVNIIAKNYWGILIFEFFWRQSAARYKPTGRSLVREKDKKISIIILSNLILYI